MMLKENKILSRLLNLDIAVASIALVILVSFTFGGVVMRYVMGKPLGWIEEIQTFCIVWIVFASGGAAFRTGSHVAIELLAETFPKKAQKLLEVFIAIVTAVTLGYLLKTSLDYMQLFIRTGRTTSILNISYLVIYAVVPVSCVLQILNYFLVYVWGYKDEVQSVEQAAEEAVSR